MSTLLNSVKSLGFVKSFEKLLTSFLTGWKPRSYWVSYLFYMLCHTVKII
jgi:hypothetical protein